MTSYRIIAKYYGDQMKGHEMGKACSTHVAIRNAHEISISKHKSERQLRRWEDNIKLDL